MVHRNRLLPTDYFENSQNSFGVNEAENMIHIDQYGLKIHESNLNVFQKKSLVQRKDSVSYILVYEAEEVIQINKLRYKLSTPFPLATLTFSGYLLWKSYQLKEWVDINEDWVTSFAGVSVGLDAGSGSFSIIRDLLKDNKRRWQLVKIIPISNSEFEKLTFVSSGN